MYLYDELDRTLVSERVSEFRDQVKRRLSGELTEDEFKPLRLMNGVYLQLHAYMLRIAIPYGTLSSAQMRTLAHVARKFDRGYGHFTTRQNLQFNWIPLTQAADVMDLLAAVDMHGIQTSGNCIRNITSDERAGVAVVRGDSTQLSVDVPDLPAQLVHLRHTVEHRAPAKIVHVRELRGVAIERAGEGEPLLLHGGLRDRVGRRVGEVTPRTPEPIHGRGQAVVGRFPEHAFDAPQRLGALLAVRGRPILQANRPIEQGIAHAKGNVIAGGGRYLNREA